MEGNRTLPDKGSPSRSIHRWSSNSSPGDEDDDEWEESEGVAEDVEGAETMEEQQSCDLPCLRLIMEAGLHSKVVGVYQCTCSVFPTAPESLKQRLASLLSASLLTLQNFISSLPVDCWTAPLSTLWPSLFSLPSGYTDETFPIMGVLIAMVEKLDSTDKSTDFERRAICDLNTSSERAHCKLLENHQINEIGPPKLKLWSIKVEPETTKCVTEDQLSKLCEVGGCAGLVGVRVDVMRLLGSIARLALKDTSNAQPSLKIIGAALRDCVQKDPSLWVVCQALDSIFDMFGSDSCPADLFSSLSLLPTLKNTAATFTARFRVEKKSLKSQLPLVKSARVNLPRFIDYMASKR